ncbi:MAG TPA: LamG domain-containing protein [Nevskiaceae bacterium]|nr:LamG domain-containing protein [Nevskiaceae bacterium]
MFAAAAALLCANKPDPYLSSVVALLHMNGANNGTTFTDQIGHTFTANGDAKTATDISKFNGSDGKFDGSGDYLTTPHASAFDLHSGDWTIECWIYLQATTAGNQDLIQKDGVFGSSFSQYELSVNSSGKLRGSLGTGNGTSSSQTFTGTTTITQNAWHHVAMVRFGSLCLGFLDGGLEWSTTITATITDGGKALYIGYQQGQPSSSYFNGRMAEVRITKGVARYTAAFNPPAVAFPDS